MGKTGCSKLLVMPAELLTMAFGLAETCLGKAITMWFLLLFLLEGLTSFYIFPYCYGLIIEFRPKYCNYQFLSH